MTPNARPPSKAAVRLVGAFPDGEWLTERQVAELAAQVNLDLRSRTVRSVLGEARRRSWVRRNNIDAPTVCWQRTPKGQAETVTAHV